MRTTSTALMLVLATAVAGCVHEQNLSNQDGQLPAEITGTTWEWEAATTVLGEMIPDAPQKYTLRFDPAGRVSIQSDCNSGSAPIGVGNNRQIQIGPPVTMTRAACEPKSLSEQFVVELGRVRIWTLREGKLYLSFPGDGGGLRFRPGS